MQTKLGRAAELHSQDQAAHEFSGHTGSDGSSPEQRLTAAGYSWQARAENVAWHNNDGSAQMAFNLWQNSESHRATLLSSAYWEIGVGRAQSTTGFWYWTADFARPT